MRDAKKLSFVIVSLELFLVAALPLFSTTKYPVQDFTGPLVFLASVFLLTVLGYEHIFKRSLFRQTYLLLSSIALVLTATAASAIVSGHFLLSLFDFNIGVTSGVAIFIFFTHLLWAHWFGFSNFITYKKSVTVFLIAASVTFIVSNYLDSLVFDEVVPFLVGVVAFGVMLHHDFLQKKGENKIYYFFVAVTLVVLFFMSTIWTSILLLVLGIYTLFISQKNFKLIAIVTVYIFLLLSFNFVNQVPEKKDTVTYVSFLPTLQTTVSFSRRADLEQLIFGHGSSFFTEFWYSYRPTTMNMLPSWYYEYTIGGGFILTHMLMTGLLGIFTWLFFLFSYLSLFLKNNKNIFKKENFDKEYIFHVLVLTGTFLMLFVGNITYFGLVVTALVLGFLIIQKQSFKSDVIPPAYPVNFKKIYFLLSFLGVLVLSYSVLRIGFSAYYFDQGLSLYQDNVLSNQVLDRFDKAIKIRDHPDILRGASQVSLMYAEDALVQKGDDIATANLLTKSLLYANSASVKGFSDFRNWVALGDVYLTLIKTNANDAHDLAVSAYKKAQSLTRTHAGITLRMVEVDFLSGQYDGAMQKIVVAVLFRSNFTAAWDFMTRLQKEYNVDVLPTTCINWKNY